MCLIQEFKEFALKGNVMDLAVGVVIGGAFGKIVSSLVADVIMPLVGLASGGVDFKTLNWVLAPATVDATGKAVAAVTLNYGNFIQAIVDFLIIAFSIFMAIKALNNMKRKEAEAPTVSAEPTEAALLTEIRDLLAKK